MRNEIAGATKLNNAHDVRCPRTQFPLLPSAPGDRRQQSRPVASKKGAGNSLGPVAPVTANREEIDFELLDVDWDLSECLGSIDLQEGTRMISQLAHLKDRLNRSNLGGGDRQINVRFPYRR